MQSSTSDAHCMVCGDRLKWWNGMDETYKRGVGKVVTPNKRWQGQPVWSHDDGMKRDHQAVPHDDRSHEEEAVRHAHRTGQAEMQVHQTLQRNFDYLHAENTINDIFKDRRE